MIGTDLTYKNESRSSLHINDGRVGHGLAKTDRDGLVVSNETVAAVD